MLLLVRIRVDWSLVILRCGRFKSVSQHCLVHLLFVRISALSTCTIALSVGGGEISNIFGSRLFQHVLVVKMRHVRVVRITVRWLVLFKSYLFIGSVKWLLTFSSGLMNHCSWRSLTLFTMTRSPTMMSTLILALPWILNLCKNWNICLLQSRRYNLFKFL